MRAACSSECFKLPHIKSGKVEKVWQKLSKSFLAQHDVVKKKKKGNIFLCDDNYIFRLKSFLHLVFSGSFSTHATVGISGRTTRETFSRKKIQTSSSRRWKSTAEHISLQQVCTVLVQFFILASGEGFVSMFTIKCIDFP